MKRELNIIKGDATLPIFTTQDKVNELRIIVHICNDINRWGKGFVVPLGERYPEAQLTYLKAAAPNGYHKLGSITHILISENLMIVNMVAQRGITKDPKTGEAPIRYEALKECLQRLKLLLKEEIYSAKIISIHMPKIGCGLAGGDWNIVSKILENELQEYFTVVYLNGD